ncbi:MAG TPA: hypothetical protein PKI24_22165 [Nitrospira sp.]|nr:hypothetical protein [Nitrospira sp.]
MASRLNPESADFDVRRRAVEGSKSRGRIERADDFFADDDSEDDKEAATNPFASALADAERERKRAEMKIVSEDLARLGYRPEDIARILAGTWSTADRTAPQVSGPVYEGFTLRSVPGKVLERLRGK